MSHRLRLGVRTVALELAVWSGEIGVLDQVSQGAGKGRKGRSCLIGARSLVETVVEPVGKGSMHL